jgi:hypothetical protein
MIINDDKKILFVHIQKTAGLSVSGSLNELKGSTDLNHLHSFLNTLDISKYKNYFKFCFVRNPWDRLVSWYNMFLKKGVHNKFSKYILTSKNFSDFLRKTDIIYDNDVKYKNTLSYPKSISFNQLDYITDINGDIGVNYIGKFENINEDFDYIKNKIGLNTTLKHINKYEHKDYRTYYNDFDIEVVYNMYKRDIDYFGYKF